MCDYSLHHVLSRPAKVGDKLTTHNFGAGTRGFAAQEDPTVAVCVLPGTELAFSRKVTVQKAGFFRTGSEVVGTTTAIFRQLNKTEPHTHHDALEFPDGRVIMLTALEEAQEATVLQLPVAPTTAAEKEAQTRVSYVG